MIELQHIDKIYHTSSGDLHALKDINLTINEGEIFGIIGLSGAGKSTLVRCINMLEKPTSGKVIVDGQEMTALGEEQLRKARQNIGMIFQHFNLLSSRTVFGNIAFPLEIQGLDKAAIQKKVEPLLDLVGLKDRADHYPSQLSGGQKQRVAIAGVLALEPRCIVFDEPTAMLDPKGRKEIVSTVLKLNKEKHITIVYITHKMEEAILADRIIAMEKGKIVLEGTPKEVFTQVDRIRGLGLECPLAAEVADALDKQGHRLPPIITHKELCEALCPSK